MLYSYFIIVGLIVSLQIDALPLQSDERVECSTYCLNNIQVATNFHLTGVCDRMKNERLEQCLVGCKCECHTSQCNDSCQYVKLLRVQKLFDMGQLLPIRDVESNTYFNKSQLSYLTEHYDLQLRLLLHKGDHSISDMLQRDISDVPEVSNNFRSELARVTGRNNELITTISTRNHGMVVHQKSEPIRVLDSDGKLLEVAPKITIVQQLTKSIIVLCWSFVSDGIKSTVNYQVDVNGFKYFTPDSCFAIEIELICRAVPIGECPMDIQITAHANNMTSKPTYYTFSKTFQKSISERSDLVMVLATSDAYVETNHLNPISMWFVEKNGSRITAMVVKNDQAAYLGFENGALKMWNRSTKQISNLVQLSNGAIHLIAVDRFVDRFVFVQNITSMTQVLRVCVGNTHITCSKLPNFSTGLSVSGVFIDGFNGFFYYALTNGSVYLAAMPNMHMDESYACTPKELVKVKPSNQIGLFVNYDRFTLQIISQRQIYTISLTLTSMLPTDLNLTSRYLESLDGIYTFDDSTAQLFWYQRCNRNSHHFSCIQSLSRKEQFSTYGAEPHSIAVIQKKPIINVISHSTDHSSINVLSSATKLVIYVTNNMMYAPFQSLGAWKGGTYLMTHVNVTSDVYVTSGITYNNSFKVDGLQPGSIFNVTADIPGHSGMLLSRTVRTNDLKPLRIIIKTYAGQLFESDGVQSEIKKIYTEKSSIEYGRFRRMKCSEAICNLLYDNGDLCTFDLSLRIMKSCITGKNILAFDISSFGHPLYFVNESGIYRKDNSLIHLVYWNKLLRYTSELILNLSGKQILVSTTTAVFGLDLVSKQRSIITMQAADNKLKCSYIAAISMYHDHQYSVLCKDDENSTLIIVNASTNVVVKIIDGLPNRITKVVSVSQEIHYFLQDGILCQYDAIIQSTNCFNNDVFQCTVTDFALSRKKDTANFSNPPNINDIKFERKEEILKFNWSDLNPYSHSSYLLIYDGTERIFNVSCGTEINVKNVNKLRIAVCNQWICGALKDIPIEDGTIEQKIIQNNGLVAILLFVLVAVVVSLICIKVGDKNCVERLTHNFAPVSGTSSKIEGPRIINPYEVDLQFDSTEDAKKILGSGNHGTVYETLLNNTEWVAVKVLENPVAIKLMGKEAEVLNSLSEYLHPNIVQFKGVIKTHNAIVMELVKGGNLLQYLESQRDKKKRNKHTVSMETLLKIIERLVAALDYLESKNIIHRDLSAQNVLVDDDVVKLADFGLSRILNIDKQYKFTTAGVAMQLRRMAPESMSTHCFNTKTDVYAFGILLHEIFTLGEQPYARIANDGIIEFVQSGGRMHQSALCPDLIFNVIKNCWHQEPDMRPSFHELVETIKDIHKVYREAGGIFSDPITEKNVPILNNCEIEHQVAFSNEAYVHSL